MAITQNNSSRDLPLDFVKGMLVIVMVIYHIMNYFSTAGPSEFGYIRFVSGSFIFISGFIIATFYEKRYRFDRSKTSMRLLVRGLKLLLIFTVLNLLIILTGIGNIRKMPLNIEQYLNNFIEIYGRGNSKYAAFQILLPISYILIISPAFLFFNRFKKTLIIITLLIGFIFSLLNIVSANINLGIVGVIGVSVGIIKNDFRKKYCVKNKIIISCVIIICVFIMSYLDRNLLTYSLGIMIVLKLCYDFAESMNLRGYINQHIILFGQYTLVCYITQIAFLQWMLRLLPKQKWGFGFETITIFIVTIIFLWTICLFISYLREKYKNINEVYKVIFS